MFLLLTQAPADHLHQLVSQHGDEQVAVGALLLLVIDRRLEGTKHCFQIGEHDVGAPHRLGVPIGLVAAQAVHSRMGQLRARHRIQMPGDGGGLLAVGVRGDLDLVMLSGPAAVAFQAPDPGRPRVAARRAIPATISRSGRTASPAPPLRASAIQPHLGAVALCAPVPAARPPSRLTAAAASKWRVRSRLTTRAACSRRAAAPWLAISAPLGSRSSTPRSTSPSEILPAITSLQAHEAAASSTRAVNNGQSRPWRLASGRPWSDLRDVISKSG